MNSELGVPGFKRLAGGRQADAASDSPARGRLTEMPWFGATDAKRSA